MKNSEMAQGNVGWAVKGHVVATAGNAFFNFDIKTLSGMLRVHLINLALMIVHFAWPEQHFYCLFAGF